jgi:small subunit ribosomal protein S6
MFIIDVTGGEETTAAVVAKFKTLIEANGTIDTYSEWGKRRLAYPINDLTEGYYVLVTFKSEPGFIAELQRLFNINENIMRSLIIKA